MSRRITRAEHEQYVSVRAQEDEQLYGAHTAAIGHCKRTTVADLRSRESEPPWERLATDPLHRAEEAD